MKMSGTAAVGLVPASPVGTSTSTLPNPLFVPGTTNRIAVGRSRCGGRQVCPIPGSAGRDQRLPLERQLTDVRSAEPGHVIPTGRRRVDVVPAGGHIVEGGGIGGRSTPDHVQDG